MGNSIGFANSKNMEQVVPAKNGGQVSFFVGMVGGSCCLAFAAIINITTRCECTG
ncbi:MAG: hypothetical protein ABI416_05880 [Ginsengibacter sp.]